MLLYIRYVRYCLCARTTHKLEMICGCQINCIFVRSFAIFAISPRVYYRWPVTASCCLLLSLGNHIQRWCTAELCVVVAACNLAFADSPWLHMQCMLSQSLTHTHAQTHLPTTATRSRTHDPIAPTGNDWKCLESYQCPHCGGADTVYIRHLYLRLCIHLNMQL